MQLLKNFHQKGGFLLDSSAQVLRGGNLLYYLYDIIKKQTQTYLP